MKGIEVFKCTAAADFQCVLTANSPLLSSLFHLNAPLALLQLFRIFSVDGMMLVKQPLIFSFNVKRYKINRSLIFEILS